MSMLRRQRRRWLRKSIKRIVGRKSGLAASNLNKRLTPVQAESVAQMFSTNNDFRGRAAEPHC